MSLGGRRWNRDWLADLLNLAKVAKETHVKSFICCQDLKCFWSLFRSHLGKSRKFTLRESLRWAPAMVSASVNWQLTPTHRLDRWTFCALPRNAATGLFLRKHFQIAETCRVLLDSLFSGPWGHSWTFHSCHLQLIVSWHSQMMWELGILTSF